MTTCIANMQPRKAAIIVGISLIAMFFLAFLIDDVVLANFIGPGDTATLASDIEADGMRFGIAVAGYLTILMLDAAIALALCVILKPASKILALFTAKLRLAYTIILVISLLALVFQLINVYSYGTIKLVGYHFFALHILVLGYAIIKSGYIPKVLGILLLIAGFCYPVLFYGKSVVPENLLVIFVIPAAVAELLLGIWFLAKRAKLS